MVCSSGPAYTIATECGHQKLRSHTLNWGNIYGYFHTESIDVRALTIRINHVMTNRSTVIHFDQYPRKELDSIQGANWFVNCKAHWIRAATVFCLDL